MSIPESDFELLEQELSNGGAEAVLRRLAEQLRAKAKYHELFEALKMQLRQQLGLPLLFSDDANELDEPTRDKLDQGLLDICQQIGRHLLEQGSAREGWMYWRPLGRRQEAADLLGSVEANDDNLDELVEVFLREGVDPGRGYSLILEHYGTCNAITTLEGELYQRPKPEQQVLVGLLLKHVHAELLANVRADISQHEQRDPPEHSLAELIADRDWMFTEYSYHIDTTHLASTVRFARRLEKEDELRLARDLTQYGKRLNSQFQYPGDEPFNDLYHSHELFFQVLLGENVDEALSYFQDKAETVDPDEHGCVAIETYVDLLARADRFEQAIKVMVDQMPQGSQPAGICPSLFELAEKANQFEDFLRRCREQEDLLGFATGLIHTK